MSEEHEMWTLIDDSKKEKSIHPWSPLGWTIVDKPFNDTKQIETNKEYRIIKNSKIKDARTIGVYSSEEKAFDTFESIKSLGDYSLYEREIKV